ncbi:MAG: L7Ae/L30e/S12e/Gadd45 family ribosomal protein [Oscillospiraceae bacterium]
MNKTLNYMGLAKKAGLFETGEENAGAAVRAGKARLVILASDASDNARRRAEGFVAGKKVPLVTVPFTKDDISSETGRPGCAMAAFTDIGFAASFASSLAETDSGFEALAETIHLSFEKTKKRRQEAKAHERNKKIGKRRKSV